MPITKPRTGMPIGALSRATGCNIETVRYYERVGVLPPPQRSKNGRRAYQPDDARRLLFVRRARDLGFPLDDVRDLLALADRERSCRDVRRLAAAHLELVRGKIADLRRMETILARTVRHCRDGNTLDCPILNALREI